MNNVNLSSKKILVFGTGKICQDCIEYLGSNEVVGYLDNNPTKQGALYNGMYIYDPQYAISVLNYDVIYIFTKYIDDVKKQLISLGVRKEKIFTYRQIIDNYDKYVSSLIYKDKKQKFSLECVNGFLSGNIAIFHDDYSVMEIFKYICHKYVVLNHGDILPEVDMIVYHGMGMTPYKYEIYIQAIKRDIPVVLFEDGFLRSVYPAGFSGNKEMVIGRSIILDGRGLYINAYSESEMERILNSGFMLSALQKKWVQKIIKQIVDNKLSKYNYQPLYGDVPGRKGREKVLIIDQVPADKSIDFGMASDKTFSDMLNAALEDNPNADILIKKHPVAEKTHYVNVENNQVYLMEEPINPIVLLEQVDKVYVCSSQMGFEALLCGKEVHVFGMPFYAGWGVTVDRQICCRRRKKRSIEEIFYVAYVLLTKYISVKNKRQCEIEDVIDELIDLRSEFFSKSNR